MWHCWFLTGIPWSFSFGSVRNIKKKNNFHGILFFFIALSKFGKKFNILPVSYFLNALGLCFQFGCCSKYHKMRKCVWIDRGKHNHDNSLISEIHSEIYLQLHWKLILYRLYAYIIRTSLHRSPRKQTMVKINSKNFKLIFYSYCNCQYGVHLLSLFIDPKDLVFIWNFLHFRQLHVRQFELKEQVRWDKQPCWILTAIDLIQSLFIFSLNRETNNFACPCDRDYFNFKRLWENKDAHSRHSFLCHHLSCSTLYQVWKDYN